jgi:gas vesicle protein
MREDKNMDQYNSMETENKSTLLKGMLIGALVGGALTMLSSSTRSSVKQSAVSLKDSSMDLINQVKENPGDVKDEMINRFKSASETLKEAISDAQALYTTVNEEVFSKVAEVKDISSSALSTAKDATGELKDIGSKVAEAGSEIKETPSAISSDSNPGKNNTRLSDSTYSPTSSR